jgi:hypothetical protein
MSRLILCLGLLASRALAEPSYVAVSVEVAGRDTPLYPGRDGRLYLEARAGAPYAVRLRNQTGERLGVALDVDGLNVIDGLVHTSQERLYVLGPYETTLVRGWRSSLSEVHLFTFVDESVSYAARTGQANGRMGWIEAKVFREQAPVAMAYEKTAPQDAARAPGAASAARAYPGTGWGTTTSDQAIEVSFDPQPTPCQTATLRYEYRPALVALGIFPHPFRDRLLEREAGAFAKPPLP